MISWLIPGASTEEDGIVTVVRFFLLFALVTAAGLQLALGVVEQIVRQRVAAGLTDLGIIRDAAVRLQDLDTHVGAIGVVHRLAHRLTGHLTGETVVQEIIRSAARIAKAKHIRTLAEGVETQEQADMLSEVGCDYAQGYLYGHPMTAKEAEHFIRTHTIRKIV